MKVINYEQVNGLRKRNSIDPWYIKYVPLVSTFLGYQYSLFRLLIILIFSFIIFNIFFLNDQFMACNTKKDNTKLLLCFVRNPLFKEYDFIFSRSGKQCIFQTLPLLATFSQFKKQCIYCHSDIRQMSSDGGKQRPFESRLVKQNKLEVTCNVMKHASCKDFYL